MAYLGLQFIASLRAISGFTTAIPSIKRIEDYLNDSEVENSALAQSSPDMVVDTYTNPELETRTIALKKHTSKDTLEMEGLLLEKEDGSDGLTHDDVYSPQQRVNDLLALKPIAVQMKNASFSWELVRKNTLSHTHT